MANYKSPGVYIEEINAFLNSAVAVETAIPAFIGYTFKAERNGKDIVRVPTVINSFAEYTENFGGAFPSKFKVAPTADLKNEETFKLGTKDMTLTYAEHNEVYFFNSIRLFYANGGGQCIILSVGTYGATGMVRVKESDFMATEAVPIGPLELLKNEQLPTLMVLPDVVALGSKAYPIYKNVLAHCAETQRRFGLFDLKKHDNAKKQTPLALLKEFRAGIGVNFLNYGAAYYPWLNTNVVGADELTFENFVELKKLLEADPTVQEIFTNYTKTYCVLKAAADKLNAAQVKPAVESKVKIASLPEPAVIKFEVSYKDKMDEIANLNKKTHLALKSSSLFYRILLKQATTLANQMPPSAAMAGLCAMVDATRGVWKSPANYSLNGVDSPMVKVSSKLQQDFNVDPLTGKSVNVIRPFKGLGTLVWGARTLDGNSNDWKYINVRRTMIMIEQSIKAATRAYVFEPNDANTWITVKAMINNFLTNLWKQGALAGAVPEQAFDVQIGLGASMTPTDILDGKMLISVKVAIVRPAEFIIITFQQQLQQS